MMSDSLFYRHFRLYEHRRSVEKECGEVSRISLYLTGVLANYTYMIVFATAQVAHAQGRISQIRPAYYTPELLLFNSCGN